MKTVANLIEELQKLPQESYVVLARDEEGNGFEPWSGDFGIGKFVKEDRDYQDDENIDADPDDEDYDIYREEGVSAIVLWP